MVIRPMSVGRRTGALLLVAASISLHALVFGRLTGWFGGDPATSAARPVDVALLPPLSVVPPPPPPVSVAPPPAPPATPPRRAPPPRAAVPRLDRPVTRPAAPDTPPAPAQPSGEAAPSTVSVAAWEAPETLSSADTQEAGTVMADTAKAESAKAGSTKTDSAKADDGVAADPSAAAGTSPDSGAPPPPAVAKADAAAPSAEREAAAAALPVVPGLPASHSRQFRVYWGDFTEQRSVARLAYRLTREDDRYEIRTEGEAEGLISLFYSGTLSQVSRGRLGPHGLAPQRYVEQRGKRPERSVSFDQERHRLLPAGAPPVPLPPGTQDRLSVIYQIGLLARGDPASFVAGATRDVPVATLRSVEIQRFTVVGDEMLMTPAGPIRSLHLRRPPVAGSDDPSIDLWLGYDFDMLPVRLRVQDADRRVLDQLIERDG
jgi:hypothetical protein